MREVDNLIRLVSRLPGLGQRSARRIVLSLIKKPDSLLTPLQDALSHVAKAIVTCQQCGNIDTVSPCQICAAPGREARLICVVEEISDLWALERAGGFQGHYHVLGGTLSALDGVGPDQLNLNNLRVRVEELMRNAKTDDAPLEIILATNLTVEGQATAHYIQDILKTYPVSLSRLAHGVPVGGELDFLDDGTLRAALRARGPCVTQ